MNLSIEGVVTLVSGFYFDCRLIGGPMAATRSASGAAAAAPWPVHGHHNGFSPLASIDSVNKSRRLYVRVPDSVAFYHLLDRQKIR